LLVCDANRRLKIEFSGALKQLVWVKAHLWCKTIFAFSQSTSDVAGWRGRISRVRSPFMWQDRELRSGGGGEIWKILGRWVEWNGGWWCRK
jgi:hypothetical protein